MRQTPYALRLPNPGKHLYPPPLTTISADQFKSFLDEGPRRSHRAQLYVHVPFCETICTFCPIYKFRLSSAESVTDYLNALKVELRSLAGSALARSLRFDSVYFGGGTPSVLSDSQIFELVDLINREFHLDQPQMTFEGHIHSLTRDKLRLVRSLGFNRVSAGVQTFDQALRRALNLTPTEREIFECVAEAREVGFDDFNIDMMYNLPGQTPAIWHQDLVKAVELRPSGFDVYETVVSHSTPLHGQIKHGDLKLETDPRMLAQSYWTAEEVLGASGYEQRNVFVWDQPGFENRLVGLQGELRDNSVHVLGAGLSAYSLVNGRSFINHTNRRHYIEAVSSTGHGVESFHQCTPEEEMERFMIMSLEEFRLEGSQFRVLFGRSMVDEFPNQLRSFVRRNLVRREGESFVLTRLGRAWATTMAIEFFGGPVLEDVLRARLGESFLGGMTHEEELVLPLFAVFHPDVLLKQWWNPALIVAYVRVLQRANRQWSSTWARLFWSTVKRRWVPAFGWYLRMLGLHMRGRRIDRRSDALT